MVLERVPYDPTRWEATIAGHPDLEVYHGSGWLDYLAASQGAEPVIATVRADGQPVGHFVGAIVRRYGIRILGSPLPGWTTQTMGFLLEDGVDRRAAAEALLPFAFRDLGCLHVELADRHLTADQMAGSGYVVEVERSFVIDLARPEEDVFAGMHAKTGSTCARPNGRPPCRSRRRPRVCRGLSRPPCRRLRAARPGADLRRRARPAIDHRAAAHGTAPSHPRHRWGRPVRRARGSSSVATELP